MGCAVRGAMLFGDSAMEWWDRRQLLMFACFAVQLFFLSFFCQKAIFGWSIREVREQYSLLSTYPLVHYSDACVHLSHVDLTYGRIHIGASHSHWNTWILNPHLLDILCSMHEGSEKRLLLLHLDHSQRACAHAWASIPDHKVHNLHPYI